MNVTAIQDLTINNSSSGNLSLVEVNYCDTIEDCSLTESLWKMSGVPQGLFYLFIIFFSLFGNIIVIKTVEQDSEMSKSYSNIFLVNLALCDIAQAGLMLPIFGATAVLGDAYVFPPIFGTDVMCTVSKFLNQLCPAVTSYTNTIIAVDRFVAFVYPFRKRLTKLTACLIMGFTWVVSGVFCTDLFCRPEVVRNCWSGCEKRVCINNLSPESRFLGYVVM